MPIINGGNVIPGMSPSQANTISGEGPFKVARALYDFSVDGGAVGTLTLELADSIPTGAVVLGGWVDVQTIVTSGGAATVAVQLEAANDIVNAAAVSGAPWSTTGRKSIIPVFTGATTVKTSAARQIKIVIGTATLTAGKFEVFLLYLETA